MTINQAIEAVRIALGDRDEHHPFCNSLAMSLSSPLPCDCYARKIQVPHKAMDRIEDFIRDKGIPS